MADALPTHLKIFKHVPFSDEMLLVKARPGKVATRQLWYVHIRHLTRNAISEFCEHHRVTVSELAQVGGVGVVVYDLSEMEGAESWVSVTLPFVHTMQNHSLDGTLDKWLSRAIILVTDETVAATLHTIFTQMYTPTRPVEIVRSKKQLASSLAALWV